MFTEKRNEGSILANRHCCFLCFLSQLAGVAVPFVALFQNMPILGLVSFLSEANERLLKQS